MSLFGRDLPDEHLVHAFGTQGSLHEGGNRAGGHNVDLEKERQTGVRAGCFQKHFGSIGAALFKECRAPLDQLRFSKLVTL